MKNHAVVFEKAADPFVTRFDDGYLYVKSGQGDRSIEIGHSTSLKSEKLSEVAMKSIFEPSYSSSKYDKQVWAPEIHNVMGDWVVYFAASDGRNANHRIHALVADDPKNPLGNYSYAGEVKTAEDRWAIDMTYLHDDRAGKKADYAIWSGWPDKKNGRQNLYISKFKDGDPLSLEDERFEISSPDLPWEKNLLRDINEGPAVFKHLGRIWLLYAANCSWTPDYKLGLIELTGDDPLRKSSWTKQPEPFLESFGEIHGPGHASVTQDQWGNPVMFYHSAKGKYGAWNRQGRAVRLEFDSHGDPFVPDYSKPSTTSHGSLFGSVKTYAGLAVAATTSMLLRA